MMSPTVRSLKYLRQLGYLAEPCERWIPRLEIKRDLLGVADIIACHPRDKVFLLVQATSIAHVGDRLARCRKSPQLAAWLKAGGRFVVQGWGQRDSRWILKEVELRGEDMEPVVLQAPRQRRARRGERQGSLFEPRVDRAP